MQDPPVRSSARKRGVLRDKDARSPPLLVPCSATFVVGLVIGFTKGWEMALVMVGCMPFTAAIGGVLAKGTEKATAASSKAYAEVRVRARRRAEGRSRVGGCVLAGGAELRGNSTYARQGPRPPGGMTGFSNRIGPCRAPDPGSWQPPHTATHLPPCVAPRPLQASAIAQQNISQIRTVAAYNREQAAMQQYGKALELPRKMVGAGRGLLAELAGAAQGGWGGEGSLTPIPRTQDPAGGLLDGLGVV